MFHIPKERSCCLCRHGRFGLLSPISDLLRRLLFDTQAATRSPEQQLEDQQCKLPAGLLMVAQGVEHGVGDLLREQAVHHLVVVSQMFN